jgi:hypothetical protein
VADLHKIKDLRASRPACPCACEEAFNPTHQVAIVDVSIESCRYNGELWMIGHGSQAHLVEVESESNKDGALCTQVVGVPAPVAAREYIRRPVTVLRSTISGGAKSADRCRQGRAG